MLAAPAMRSRASFIEFTDMVYPIGIPSGQLGDFGLGLGTWDWGVGEEVAVGSLQRQSEELHRRARRERGDKRTGKKEPPRRQGRKEGKAKINRQARPETAVRRAEGAQGMP